MLDDIANPYFRRRRAYATSGYLSKLLTLALPIVVVCNIGLMLGVSGSEIDPAQGVRISLGLCVVTAFAGFLIGLFLACLPLAGLHYLVKLPIAALAGTVIVNALIFAGQALPPLLALVV